MDPTFSTQGTMSRVPQSLFSRDPMAVPFAVLQPANREAQEHFSLAIQHIQDRNDEYHGQFIRKTATNAASQAHMTPGTTPRGSLLPPLRHRGAFYLTYRFPNSKSTPTWVFGRGKDNTNGTPNRGVDFLPSDPGHGLSSVFSAFEFALTLHSVTGMIGIFPGPGCSGITYFSNGKWVPIGPGHLFKTWVLYQQINKICVGSQLEYELIYERPVLHTLRLRLQGQRQDFFSKSLQVLPPDTNMWPLPPREPSSLVPMKTIGQVIAYETISAGPWYTFLQGLDVEKGVPVLLQEVSIGGVEDVATKVKNQIAVCKRLTAGKGVHTLHHVWCLHQHIRNGKLGPCFGNDDRIYMYFELGRARFNTFDLAHENPELVIKLLASTLRGLCHLAAKGIVHGNITPGALLVMTTNPPYAVVTNLLNAQGVVSRDTTMSTSDRKHFCAPETWGHNVGVYRGGSFDLRADLWSWAVSILACLEPLPIVEGEAITEETNDVLQDHIRGLGRRRPEYQMLSEVRIGCTKYNPRLRYLPQHALMMPTFTSNKRKLGAAALAPPAKLTRIGYLR